jgi:hypothetical protein
MLVCVCVSPPPSLPSTALLRCTASCALGRGPVYEGVAAGCGVPVRLPVGLPLPPALAWRSHNWQLERPATETRAAPPVCVYRRGASQAPQNDVDCEALVGNGRFLIRLCDLVGAPSQEPNRAAFSPPPPWRPWWTPGGTSHQVWWSGEARGGAVLTSAPGRAAGAVFF